MQRNDNEEGLYMGGKQQGEALVDGLPARGSEQLEVVWKRQLSNGNYFTFEELQDVHMGVGVGIDEQSPNVVLWGYGTSPLQRHCQTSLYKCVCWPR